MIKGYNPNEVNKVATSFDGIKRSKIIEPEVIKSEVNKNIPKNQSYNPEEIMNGLYKMVENIHFADPSIKGEVQTELKAINPNLLFNTGTGSNSFGKDSVSKGKHGQTFGIGTISSGEGQIVLGRYNIPVEDAWLIIGNGTDDNNRSNILVVDESWEPGTGTGVNKQYVDTQDAAVLETATNRIDTAKSELEAELTNYTKKQYVDSHDAELDTKIEGVRTDYQLGDREERNARIEADDNLRSQIENKQSKLTAGYGIKIDEDNTISVTVSGEGTVPVIIINDSETIHSITPSNKKQPVFRFWCGWDDYIENMTYFRLNLETHTFTLISAPSVAKPYLSYNSELDVYYIGHRNSDGSSRQLICSYLSSANLFTIQAQQSDISFYLQEVIYD